MDAVNQQADREKALDRVRKLLELSRSCNQHEAAQAAARATELMLRHKIAEVELDENPEPDGTAEATLGEDGRVVTWKATLGDGIAKAFGGQFFYFSARVQNPRSPGTSSRARYHVVAPESALGAIQYLFLYLCKEVERLADEAHRQRAQNWLNRVLPSRTHNARSWKASFRLGCAHTIAERLRKQRDFVLASSSKALLIVNQEDALLAEYLKRHYPKVRAARTSTAGRDPTAFHAGAAAGRAVPIGSDPTRAIGPGSRLLPGRRSRS